MAKYSSGHNIKPFAFVSHAPDPQPTLDRSISGHSTASVLKAKLTPISEGKQLVEIEVNDVRIGRTNPSDVDVDSPDQ